MKGDKLASVVHLASPEGSENTLSEQPLIPAFFFIPRCGGTHRRRVARPLNWEGGSAVLFAQLIPC